MGNWFAMEESVKGSITKKKTQVAVVLLVEIKTPEIKGSNLLLPPQGQNSKRRRKFTVLFRK
jgi:hypothetical protein